MAYTVVSQSVSHDEGETDVRDSCHERVRAQKTSLTFPEETVHLIPRFTSEDLKTAKET